MASGKLRQLGKGLDARSLMFAKCAPDGTRAGYVSKQTIYIEAIAVTEQTLFPFRC